MADRLSLIAQLVGALVAALASIGQVRGWMHATFRDVIAGVLVLYLVGSPIYWFGGRRRLTSVLRTRATGDGAATGRRSGTVLEDPGRFRWAGLLFRECAAGASWQAGGDSRLASLNARRFRRR